ncbi:uncharacterized protein LOC119069372 [Bradysia coprophila]|uniref:uncharacterized protein LOC119069372 n=1 Tax=Bradysia coprophila TaxID=38358 RepID=UPI00187D82C7|nr:uncharacterized protein LOC119069372 [Bradysia coprophila]
MLEFRGLIASAAKNENAGFVTPQNKNALSRKTLFTDKPKMALDDVKKNSMNVITPMRNGTVEKTKQQQALFLPSTTKVKSSIQFNETIDSTPVPNSNAIDCLKNVDEVGIWNRKQLLSDHQFDLLFMSPPRMSPPSISPPSSPPPSPSPMPLPEHCWNFFSFDPVWDCQRKTTDEELDLPPLNNSFLSDENFDGTH